MSQQQGRSVDRIRTAYDSITFEQKKYSRKNNVPMERIKILTEEMDEIEIIKAHFGRKHNYDGTIGRIKTIQDQIRNEWQERKTKLDKLVGNFNTLLTKLDVYSVNLGQMVAYEDKRFDPVDTSDLWDAAKRGPLFAAQYWYYARPEAINEYDPREKRSTPLSLAVKHLRVDIVSFLIAVGADVNIASAVTKVSPLHDACFVGSLPMVKLLVTNSADVDHVDSSEESCLHWAARGGELAVINYLIKKGAQPDRVNKDDVTATELANLMYHLDIHESLSPTD